MKKFNCLIPFLLIFAVFILVGCNNDNRASYINQLEDLERTNLEYLNDWLADNSETLDDLFEVVEIHLDQYGTELDYVEQVGQLENEDLLSWDFEVEEDEITFVYVWTYTAVDETVCRLEIDSFGSVSITLQSEDGIVTAATAEERMDVSGWNSDEIEREIEFAEGGGMTCQQVGEMLICSEVVPDFNNEELAEIVEMMGIFGAICE